MSVIYSPKIEWRVKLVPSADATRLAGDFDLHPAIARILASRGFEGGPAAEAFLSPVLRNLRDPFELHGMDGAVERTLRAIRNGERICIYGDYDADGVTSTALLFGALEFLGVDPYVVIPHRIGDGYGMNAARVDEIAQAKCSLIITVDTGVGAVEPVRRAREFGIDTIVTDHHLAGEELPDCAAMVNPNRGDAYYEHGRLCGVGVAFKFVHALLKKSGKPEAEARAFLFAQLDLVAVGTIADVVPLLGENRVLAKAGLEAIGQTQRPGLRALMETIRWKAATIDAQYIGFGIGPRINAAGRTDDPRLAFELLTTSNAKRAEELARKLDGLNKDRRTIEDGILKESIVEADGHFAGSTVNALVVGGAGWHLGVVGIVASRLTEKYRVPAIVLAIESHAARGSARSVPGFDIHDALVSCAEHLETYGGHAAAAGLSVKIDNLPRFRAAMEEYSADAFTRIDRTEVIDVDAEVEPGDVDWPLYHDMKKLEPFGSENAAPVFMLRGATPSGEAKIVGRDHLRARVNSGGKSFGVIGFYKGELQPHFANGPVDLLFRPRENEWQGRKSLELELIDARPAE